MGNDRLLLLFSVGLGIVAIMWVVDVSEPVGPGTQAPSFEAVTLDGDPVNMDDLRGTVVLLNVWATWCAPCVYEMPSLERLYNIFRKENFEVVAVSVDAQFGSRDAFGRRGGDVRRFRNQHRLTFPIWQDPQGTIKRVYDVTGIPESFIIGRDGLIYRKISGPAEWDHEQYVQLIQRLLDA